MISGKLIVVGIVVLILIVLLCVGYVKAPPDKAAVISGIGKVPRVLIGKAGSQLLGN